jgi:N-methylhydantoinase B
MISDPILVEVIYNALKSLAERMSEALVHGAYSFIVREMRDCSSALFDKKGRLIAEGANVPIHLNALGPCLKTILTSYYDIGSLEPGDVILTNDPYAGGKSEGSHHLNDLIMVMPVFLENEIVAFSITMVHHRDVGSTWSPNDSWTTEIWQEGLRIPPVKICRKGVVVQDVINMVLNNTRVPVDMEGDLYAQLSACKLGSTELISLYKKYGIEIIERIIEDLLNYSETRTREEIQKLPNGIYRHEEFVIDDGYQNGPYRLKLTLTVKDDELIFNYTGTDGQIKGPINAPLAATYSATLYVVRAITDPTIPTNEGGARPITIVAPTGTLVNCKLPAGCYQRMVVCHSIVDLIMGALEQAAPERVLADSQGCSYDGCTAINTLTHPIGGEVDHRKHWGEVVPGGIGACNNCDGLSVMACHLTNCPIPPIEQQEIEAPVLFLKREIAVNSAGPGRFRGGFGQIRSWKVLGEDARFTHTSQKSKIPPQGVVGGRPGECSKWIINLGTDKEQVLPYAMGDPMYLETGDTVTFFTPGGGGYGDPLERDIELVLNDVQNELITADRAESDYGVVVRKKNNDFDVDMEATKKIRQKRLER